MKLSKGAPGVVVAGLLAGARVVFVKRQNSGQPLVRMAEDRGAYKVGDLVQLGTGEFRADEGRVS